jgi:RNA recognition motif-containing protein
MNIFVTNLSFKLQSEDLRQLFEEYGTVSSAKVILDHESGRSRGFGFVEMDNDDEGNAAIEGLNGQDIQGKEVVVQKARPREDMKKGNNFSNNNKGSYNKNYSGGNSGYKKRYDDY